MPEFNEVRAVILAGGSGTRLWPLSRLQAPKQFQRLMGTDTLLEATVARLAPMIGASQVLVVTNEETATGAGYQALERFEKILEPAARNTAAAIGIAAVRYRLAGLDPVMVVLPSDHLVQDIPAYQTALGLAISAATDGLLVTFGIRPTSPETGFGYIQANSQGGDLRKVTAFHEKPDRATAERFLASGEYFWNSGMFVWKASVILDEIAAHLPALWQTLEAIRLAAASQGFEQALKNNFANAPSISIDHGVLEKSTQLMMVPASFGWSDVGSWDAVYDVTEKDANRNALQGNVVSIDCRNTMVRSHHRLVAAVGVDDVTLIETPDAVLLTKRGASQDVRKVVEELTRRAAGTEHVLHVTVERPWGCYTVLEEGPGFKIKRIEVRPSGRLSLQRHKHRSEHWVVLGGEATVTSGERKLTLQPNESTYIPAGTMHRLENLGPDALQIIEVQVGSYVGEDDIQRFDDHYGRSKETAQTK